MSKLRHEELMDEVFPNIWLGRFEAALDDQIQNLDRLNITRIVSLGCFYGWWSLRTKPKHLLIPLEDKPLVFITDYFNDVFRFIDGAIDKNCGVLVHCEQGRSRSGAMVIAYLMKKERRPYPDILNRVLAHRKRVMPNIGFQIQLRAFASQNYNTAVKYPEIINLYHELSLALKNLHNQILNLELNIHNNEKIFVTLEHDGTNKQRNGKDQTFDTSNKNKLPQYPFEWWTDRQDDSPNHWTRLVQVGLTTEDLAVFRKEWVLLVFLCHQFQLYKIHVSVQSSNRLYLIGEMYFEDLLDTFGEVFNPELRTLNDTIRASQPVSVSANSYIPHK